MGAPLEQLVFVDDRAENIPAGAAAGLDPVLFTHAEAPCGATWSTCGLLSPG